MEESFVEKYEPTTQTCPECGHSLFKNESIVEINPSHEAKETTEVELICGNHVSHGGDCKYREFELECPMCSMYIETETEGPDRHGVYSGEGKCPECKFAMTWTG